MRWGAQGGLAALLSYPRSWSRDRSADRSPGCSTAGPFLSLPLRVSSNPGNCRRLRLQQPDSQPGLRLPETAAVASGTFANFPVAQAQRRWEEAEDEQEAGRRRGPGGRRPRLAAGRRGRERFPQKEHPTGRK